MPSMHKLFLIGATAVSAYRIAGVDGVVAGALGQKGVVSELFTFGAPGTAKTPFRDETRQDGCFQGARVYTRGEKKRVDAGAIINKLDHALMSVVTVAVPKASDNDDDDHHHHHHHRHHDDDNDDRSDSEYHPCHPKDTRLPRTGIQHWPLHYEDRYILGLEKMTLKGKQVSQEPRFKMIDNMRVMAWAIYDDLPKFKTHIETNLTNWRVVGWETITSKGDTDSIALLQKEDSLGCALVFQGTNSFGELFRSSTIHPSSYCGWTRRVHSGYKDEMKSLLKDGLLQGITAKLPKCSAVTCVGHSMGGSLCEIYSACLNARNTTDPDYQNLQWNQESAKLMAKM